MSNLDSDAPVIPYFKKSRCVFITGGSRGIGHSIRDVFESYGLEVICPSRAQLDLLSPESVAEYLQKNDSLHVDVLINNAGVNFPLLIEETSNSSLGESMQVNFMAPVALSRHFSRRMRRQGWGRIVNVSSIFSLVTKGKRSVYSSSKAALNAFTRTAAIEWGSEGVLVNAVCPGYINTDLTRQNNSPVEIDQICQQIPLKRMASPDEIAQLIVFLCSDLNTYITGQSVVIDGGFTLQ